MQKPVKCTEKMRAKRCETGAYTIWTVTLDLDNQTEPIPQREQAPSFVFVLLNHRMTAQRSRIIPHSADLKL